VSACTEHGRVRELLGKRADDTIGAVESRWLKTHLLACAECANEAAAEDPTLLFVPLSAASRRPSRLDAQISADAERVVADVLAAVDFERARRRLTTPRQRRTLLAASIALVGAGLLGYLSWKSRPAPVAESAARSTAPVRAAGVAEPATERPVIEDLKNPGATVYEFASASPKEPTLVFIVDRNADI
jgi:putative zinc finger protein